MEQHDLDNYVNQLYSEHSVYLRNRGKTGGVDKRPDDWQDSNS